MSVSGTDTTDVLFDYITGEEVPATAEEREAVQVMRRRLVEDFGYPKDHIKSRPQHRVRKSPSDASGTYPVDIAVFDSPSKLEGELRLVVECKRPKRKEGLEQPKLYMEMSAASVGVWFNGQDHLYLRKIVSPGGERSFVEIPSIPRFGQSIDDMGKQLRRDLMPASNLKAVFDDLRNHLAGNVVGITREVALAEQMLNIVFCKLYDERYTAREDVVSFRAGVQETAEEIAQRVNGLFDRVKDQYTDVFAEDHRVFAEDHRLAIDSTSLAYVVGELQNYSLMGSSRDAVADAFEVFVGPSLRGTEGQFFTPRNVVQMVVEMLDPKPEESIIDPACGSGGFLIQALDAVWARLSERAPEQVWDDQTLLEERNKVAGRLRGIDKDTFLTKVTKAYMAIMGDGRSGIFCENSLAAADTWSDKSREHVRLGTFDIVVTNPPFGSKIKINDADIISQEDVYRVFRSKCEVEVGDILLVRDGTYLIGTSAMITGADSERRLLFQSHILRLRLLKPLAVTESNHPEDTTAHAYLLFAALNSEFVSQQVRALQFTQDIIDTLGQRVKELQLPVPRDSKERQRIANETQRIVEGRSRLRSDAASLAQAMAAGYEDEATHSSSIR
ncbi:N-6 DNA methylase [Candidatus Poriferisodalis sp.]|uniref:N-6 DNA methylase n=1 Tax=Candidatus Poriferisodalis sp. TaxID=3101277 RepID=UPI003B023846